MPDELTSMVHLLESLIVPVNRGVALPALRAQPGAKEALKAISQGKDLGEVVTGTDIKASDAIFVGMFPRVRDEVRENAERACRILGNA